MGIATFFVDMTANNYQVSDAGETIVFKGVVQRSLSQALFLVFVTGISMGTLALVLNIQFDGLGTYQNSSECDHYCAVLNTWVLILDLFSLLVAPKNYL
jgi:hypothetical protein